jgi:hypothetical protein
MTKKMRRGQCGCGEVKVETTGEPSSRLICNCKSCQKRTGSDYSNNVYFLHEHVKIYGKVNGHTRSAQEERTLTNFFCPKCGMTIYWAMELDPKTTGVAVAVFDVDDFKTPKASIWEKYKRPWINFDSSIIKIQNQT